MKHLRLLLVLITLLSIPSCSSLTYVKYDKEGRGDVRVRRGTSMYSNPTFRYEDLPKRQKKWRIAKGKRKRSS